MVTSTFAFVPTFPVFSRVYLSAVNGDAPEQTSELIAAIDDVRSCAAAFSPETARFANSWIDKTLAGKQEGMAVGLLDECLLDDNADLCDRFEESLKRLDILLGVGSKEQF